MCLDEEEVLNDLWSVEEAEGKALGEEAWNDAGAEGTFRCVLGVGEEGVVDAYVRYELVYFFGCDRSAGCLEGLADFVVFVEAHSLPCASKVV